MASGDTLYMLYPRDAEQPEADYATHDLRNVHPALDFRDATTNEIVMFSFVMPQLYGGGGVTVYIHYSMETATSGDIDRDASPRRKLAQGPRADRGEQEACRRAECRRLRPR